MTDAHSGEDKTRGADNEAAESETEAGCDNEANENCENDGVGPDDV